MIRKLLIPTAAALSLFGPAAADAANAPKSDFFIPSVIAVDTTAHTGTFPLRRGSAHGKTVWYVETDTSDLGVAKAQGLVYAPMLAQLGSAVIADATSGPGGVAFAGAPDFSPVRSYIAGATGFPPASAKPGGAGDDAYSPFVRIAGQPGVVNAPIVATGDGPFDVTHHGNTEDRVVAIDTRKRTVTLALARGFVDGKAVYYLSTEASDPVAAAVERATYVPKLAKASAAGTIPIGVVVNGPLDGDAPQGLAYLALRTPLGSDATPDNVTTIGSPFNVLSLVPDLKHPYDANGYSPLWSVQVAGTAQSKRLTTFGDVAATGLKQAGFVVNCPAVAFGGSY